MNRHIVVVILFLIATRFAAAQDPDSLFVRQNYTKMERLIPMRDGVKLFTAIYVPKDATKTYPILMERTPYACDPYGENEYLVHLSHNRMLEKEKYIFVFQDVRGRYMSEGNFEEVTPHKPIKKSKSDVDESSDTFDAIEWLLKNIKGNNGNVGIYGISYPGFFATASLPESHPALKAVSPQAPVTDEFAGDDVYHNGAFFLMDNFSFYGGFDHPRTGPIKEYPRVMTEPVVSSFFYKSIEPLSIVDEKYFKGKSKIWTEVVQHDTYDQYWKDRNIRTHLKNIKPAVLIVGGWFDAEDLFGPLHTYQAIEEMNSGNNSRLLMGPWTHGAWAAQNWEGYVNYAFGGNVNERYKKIEFDFFEYYLKGKGSFSQSEATVFTTGSNEWKSFSNWPPRETEEVNFYLAPNEGLSLSAGSYESAADEYISDPNKPVPYIDQLKSGRWRSNDYMGADQRFAASRPDVLVYQSDPLENDLTLAGPIRPSLFFSTTGTDADIIVKLIDVQPDDAPNPKPNPRNVFMPQMQQLVRAEVLRGKFRNSLSQPEPFAPGVPTEVKFTLNDVCHTFRKGHRIMIQIQSSWFPLVDLNPQKFMDIPKATRDDFQKQTHKVYTGQKYPSRINALKLK